MALFGKPNTRPEEEKGLPAPAPEPPPARLAPNPQKTEAKNAVIGPQVKVSGELSGEEDILIEGRVEGKVTVTKSLRVGQNAQVNAEIRAHTVVIAGRVIGNVTAVERVEILPSGSLEGNIRSPKIAIAEGAQFKGSVDMSGGKGQPAPSAGAPAEPPKGAPAPGQPPAGGQPPAR